MSVCEFCSSENGLREFPIPGRAPTLVCQVCRIQLAIVRVVGTERGEAVLREAGSDLRQNRDGTGVLTFGAELNRLLTDDERDQVLGLLEPGGPA